MISSTMQRGVFSKQLEASGEMKTGLMGSLLMVMVNSNVAALLTAPELE